MADRSSAAPKVGQTPASKPKSKLPWIIGGIALVLVLFCLVAAFWTKDVGCTIASHSWERTIAIEQLRAESDSSWCDSTPSGAYSVSRRREQRSTRQIPDGQTCSTRNVDRGDGTFERREECKTKYRSEPVYDDKCYYTIDRWGVVRTAKSTGQGTSPAPTWPTFTLARQGNSLGCEREGAHGETYTLHLRGDDKKSYTCTQPFARWNALQDGTKKVIPIGVITDRPECDKF